MGFEVRLTGLGLHIVLRRLIRRSMAISFMVQALDGGKCSACIYD
jgi:hypothetical protein